MSKLTAKQAAFAQEYILDLNATQAAIRAGYSAHTAGRTAHELLKKPEIAAAVQQHMEERSEATKVDAAYVLNRLAEIDQMDVLDIMTPEGGLKPVPEWPPIWRQYVTSLDVSELYEVTDGKRQVVGLLKKIKWPDKLKNLELLGKHVGVQAWRDKIEHEAGEGLKTIAELMAEVAARDRQ